MPPVLPLRAVALDCLCCVGIGFFAAAIRSLLPLHEGMACFVADFCATFFALVLVGAYAAQGSVAGAVRFYMLLSLGVGAVSFYQTLAPYLLFLLGVMHAIVTVPAHVVAHQLLHPAFLRLRQAVCNQKEKYSKKKEWKNHKKQLQTPAILLYNSIMDEYTYLE